MKIDVNALLGLLVLASTVLGGWIVYLKHIKPEKTNKDKCADLEIRVAELEERDEKKEKQIKFNRDKINYIVKRLRDKSSFN
jgi:hypothetical protein